jgi:hypothetical protein
VSSDEWKKTGVGSQVLIGMRDSGCGISRISYLGSRVPIEFYVSDFDFQISLSDDTHFPYWTKVQVYTLPTIR